MRIQVILNILGILLALFSTSLLPPLALSLIYSDNTTTAFLVAYLVTLATGLACYLPTRRQGRDLRLRDGFLIVVLFWTVLASFGALPLFLSNNPAMGLTLSLIHISEPTRPY